MTERPSRRKRLSDAAVESLGEAWAAGGPKALETLREIDPSAYVRLAAAVVGRTDAKSEDRLSDMDDEELDGVIARATRALGLA